MQLHLMSEKGLPDVFVYIKVINNYASKNKYPKHCPKAAYFYLSHILVNC